MITIIIVSIALGGAVTIGLSWTHCARTSSSPHPMLWGASWAALSVTPFLLQAPHNGPRPANYHKELFICALMVASGVIGAQLVTTIRLRSGLFRLLTAVAACGLLAGVADTPAPAYWTDTVQPSDGLTMLAQTLEILLVGTLMQIAGIDKWMFRALAAIIAFHFLDVWIAYHQYLRSGQPNPGEVYYIMLVAFVIRTVPLGIAAAPPMPNRTPRSRPVSLATAQSDPPQR